MKIEVNYTVAGDFPDMQLRNIAPMVLIFTHLSAAIPLFINKRQQPQRLAASCPELSATPTPDSPREYSMAEQHSETKEEIEPNSIRVLPRDPNIVKIPGYSRDVAHVKITFEESEDAVWYAYGKYSCDGLAHALYLGHSELVVADPA